MVLVLCATTTMAKNTSTETVYNEDKQNILVTADQPTFTIELKSNPTTGYSWFLREYDTDLITAVKHKFQKGQADLMGAPGYEVWTFKVKPAAFAVPQQLQLRFIYTRPWQGSESSTQITFRISTQAK